MTAGRGGSEPHDAYTALLSHELRTPVTAILGYLDLLMDGATLPSPEELHRYLTVVRGRAADLARIVSELTTFADLTAGRDPSGSDTPQSLPEVIEHLARERPVRVDASADAVAAAVDLDRLRVALQQILENAFRFGAPNTEVVVRAALEGDPPRLVMLISNQGAPIPAELRERIFEPFRQVEGPYTRRHGGLGLGLTVARRAVEGCGGSLTLDPSPSTMFRLEMPLRDDPIARQANELRARAALADAQALRAIQDLRELRSVAIRERKARELAEEQQARAASDFRDARREQQARAAQVEHAYLDTIGALAQAVAARDGSDAGHVDRVRRYSLAIGARLGLDAPALRWLEFGAILHDVGRLAIPESILGKRGPLDSQEWDVVRQHPRDGVRLLEGIVFLEPTLDALESHHERWDGTGYPLGLAGVEIPLAGRIVAVADAYEAMIADRPYRARLSAQAARAEIWRGCGTQFDLRVATAFLEGLSDSPE